MKGCKLTVKLVFIIVPVTVAISILFVIITPLGVPVRENCSLSEFEADI